MTPGWPDLVIGIIVVFFAWKGLHNGFVSELAGPVAVLIAIGAAIRYPGTFDAGVASIVHLGIGSAHAVGTILYAIVAYAIVSLLAWLLSKLASLPGIGIVNAAGGAAIGALKALLAVWIVLYTTLFFPLTPDLRADLHRSLLAEALTAPDHTVDVSLRDLIPWFMVPLAEPFFVRHHD